MARFLALVCVLTLLASCGQIGTVSGGPNDEIAPQVTSSNLYDKQTNFKEQLIEFTSTLRTRSTRPTRWTPGSEQP